jgi:hypothetical protein
MLIEIILGTTCFVGGMIMTTTMYGIYNYWSERREIQRRTDNLYNSYLHMGMENDNKED